MPVTPATLARGPEGPPHAPAGDYRGSLDQHGYLEEEWVATGEVDGQPYRTTVLVRRARDRARFSGVVIAEPLHAMGAVPIWMYTSRYILRSGHGWVMIGAQKTALDTHVKGFDTDRYADFEIPSPPAPVDPPRIEPGLPRDPAAMQAYMAEMRRVNAA